jgi:hypothetical protein
MTSPLGPQAVPGQARVGNLKGQKDMQAHQANLSVSADERRKGKVSPMVTVRVKG